MNEKIRKIIGKILPTPKGTWNPACTYDKLDFVLYEGSGYVSLRSTENKKPYEDGKYWMYVQWLNTWIETVSYKILQFVFYNGKYYFRKKTNMSPTKENQKYWVRAKIRGEFVENRLNSTDDIVFTLDEQGNKTYHLCINLNFGINPNDPDEDKVSKYWVNINYNTDEFVSSTSYNKYDIVYKEGVCYYYKNQPLPTNTDFWAEVNFRDEWSQENIYYGYDILNYDAQAPNNLYNPCDVVKYNDMYYLCIKNTSSHSPRNSSDWVMVCQKGDQGEKGDMNTNAPVFRGTWSKDLTYHLLDVVYYNGSSYICMRQHNNIKPVGLQSSDIIYWQLICRGIDFTITDTGEVIFNNAKITGVKTYIDNVYIKENENEIPLTNKIQELQEQLDYCKEILKKYQLD